MVLSRLQSSIANSVSHIKTSTRAAHGKPAALHSSFAAVLGTTRPQTSSSTTSPSAPAAEALSPSLKALFTQGPLAATSPAADSTQTPDPHSVPTLASVFGPTPWLANPQGRDPNGNPFNFNPIYFATAATAAKVAQMTGGKVVVQNAILTNGPITQSQPNYLVELPNGARINPGLVASFYTHGFPQFYVDQMVAQEIAGGISA
jgi:hypothetical protein